MAKKNTKGRLLIIIGTVLLLAALSLVLWNNYRQRKSNDEMLSTLSELKAQIVQNSDSTDDEKEDLSSIELPDFDNDDGFEKEEEEKAQDADKAEMESVEVEQKQYIGVLQIPALNLELPVMSDWSYQDLYISACRYSGSVQGGNLIIAAHNYRYFFGPIDNLNSGDELIFTAVDGSVSRYTVIQSDLIDGSDSNSLLANSDEWDLTLFTCTWSGTSRIAVRARVAE